MKPATWTWTDHAGHNLGHLWTDWAANHGVDRETFEKGLLILRDNEKYYADKGFRALENAARNVS